MIYARDGRAPQVHIEAVHDGSECTGNTVNIYNINIVLDKDADMSKLSDVLKDIINTNPVSIHRMAGFK
jgi:hypothetical protein